VKTIQTVDLWGDPVVLHISESKSPRKPTVPKGYAAQPGTGPKGETCRTCQHKASTGNSHARVYWKCKLMRAVWTGGPGTDIKVRTPACKRWEAITTKEPA
jgi:hypothetical protein